MGNTKIKNFLKNYLLNDYTPLLIAVLYRLIFAKLFNDDFSYKEAFAGIAVVQSGIFAVSLINKSDKTVYYGKGRFDYFIRQIFTSIFFIVITFAYDYYIIHLDNIYSFRYSAGNINRIHDRIFDPTLVIDFLYFSCTTFTTTGYGDIRPYSNLARIFCVMQLSVSFFVAYYILNYFANHLEISKKIISKISASENSHYNLSNKIDKHPLKRIFFFCLFPFILTILLLVLHHNLKRTPFLNNLEYAICFLIIICLLGIVINFLFITLKRFIVHFQNELPFDLPSRRLLYLYSGNLFLLWVSYFLFGSDCGNIFALLTSVTIPLIYYYTNGLRFSVNPKNLNLIFSVILSLIPYVFSYGILLLLVWLNNPDSFKIESPNPEKSLYQISDFLYYSVVTFSTTGYGDIFPTSTMSKSLISIKVISNLFVVFYFISNSLNISSKE